jgi:hypothetical protein
MYSTPVVYTGLKLGLQIYYKDGSFHFAAEILVEIPMRTA